LNAGAGVASMIAATASVPREHCMKNVMKIAVCSLLASSPVWAGPADSGAPVCELVEGGFVEVDGMLDEWRGISVHRVPGAGKNASFSLRCAYDNEQLFVAVDVRDQELVRLAKGGSEDRLVLELSAAGGRAATLEVFPGVEGIDPRRRWKNKVLREEGAVLVEDTRQEHGWSMEASIPLRQIDGLGVGAPGISARIAYRDADRSGQGGQASFEGTLVFRASAEAFRGFLGAAKLKPGDIRVDVTGDFDSAPGVERMVAGGAAMGIITDQYSYTMLPVTSPADVRRIEVVDLRGDGTKSVLTELRQHGNGGSRDLVIVWGLAAQDRFERVLAVEVRKELGSRKMRNRWSLVPRAGGRGQELLIEVGPDDVQGWTANNYLESPAEDVRPILKPWGDEAAVRFEFEGNTAVEVEARAPARKPGKRRPR
jgi:hypothetical protein